MPLRPPGFEGRAGFAQPERKEGSFDLDKAHQAAQEVIAREAIDPRSLGQPFNQRDVLADMQHARDKEDEFARSDDAESVRARKLAKVLEVAIHEQVKNGWFGPDAHTVLPSKYDDIKNGVDLITEFDIKEANVTAHAAMGIDVSYSQDLKRKIHGIKEEIDAGQLGTVKYYKSRDGRFTGSLGKIPHVVVGMDEKSAMTVARAWHQKNPALKTDPLRDQLLIQVIDQCSAFEQYAARRGRPEAASAYRLAGRLFQRAYGQQVTPEKRSKFAADRMFRSLELLIHQLEQ